MSYPTSQLKVAYHRFTTLQQPEPPHCTDAFSVLFQNILTIKKIATLDIFTREYTQYTAGSTFCFVVLVVLLGNRPLVS
jgi:hypothetical protein